MTKSYQDQLIKLLFVMIVSLCFLLPFALTKGSMYGDDLHFHIMRMESLSNVLKSPVNFLQFYHGGQAINLFYPYLLYAPYFIFYKLIGDFWLAWLCYLFLLTNATLHIAYYAAKTMTQSTKVGMVFALLYGFSAYRSHNILARFAVGEFISSAVLPLVFCGLYVLLQSKGRKWLTLSLGMTLLIYSHVMSAIITTAILGLLCLVTIFCWKDRLATLLGIVKAALLTLVLTATFWIPMLEQFLTIKIAGVTKLAISLHSLPIREVLIDNLRNDILSHHIGLMFPIMLVFLLTRVKHFSRLDWLVFGLGIGFWLSTTTLVNWDSLDVLHRGFIQLPWRFNTYALLMMSYVTASQVKNIKGTYLLALPIFVIGLHVLSVRNAVHRLGNAPVQFPWTELSQRNDYQQLTTSVFVPDYTNLAVGFTDNINSSDPRWHVVQNQVYLNQTHVPSENHYTADQASFIVDNPFPQAATAYLPVYFYKGQSITVNGQKVPGQVSPLSSTQIELKQGTNRITVSYHYTLLARLAQVTSLVGFLVLLLSRTGKTRRHS